MWIILTLKALSNRNVVDCSCDPQLQVSVYERQILTSEDEDGPRAKRVKGSLLYICVIFYSPQSA